jgi:hypothetical protein
MLTHSVWQGLDRLPFYENAILIETKARSQGKSTRAGSRQDDPVVLPDDELSRQIVRDMLDDFALVAAGNGGKGNQRSQQAGRKAWPGRPAWRTPRLNVV